MHPEHTDAARLSSLLSGERDLTLTAAEKLCSALGFRLASGEGASEATGRKKRKPKDE